MSIRAGAGAGIPEVAARVRPGERKLDRGGTGTSETQDFSLVRVLGKGGMGIVYSARQVSLDREIALKMIQSGDTQDPESIGKFLSEAVVTGELDHPNIVPVYDVGRTSDGTVFYAMKEVSGTSWDKILRTNSLDANLRILMSVCDAVAFAHDKGVIHRDLKPENIMLGDYGEVYVMDWGLAVDVAGGGKAAALSPDVGLAGTPAYMAPEMALCDASSIGTASEIYLLGGILYEVVTGRRPHTGHDVYACVAAAMENIIQPTDMKGELVDIARKALATHVNARHATVKEFQQAIRDYQSHAQSLQLTTAADARLAALEQVGEVSFYREATEIVASYQQALELWSENGVALLGLRLARQRLVTSALARGDLTLAESHLAALEAEEKVRPVSSPDVQPLDGLSRQVLRAKKDAAVRERLIRLSAGVALLAVVATLVVMGAAFVLTKGERDHARTAEQEAVKERDRATAAEREEADRRKEVQVALSRLEDENYYNVIALAERRIEESQTAGAETLLWNTPVALRGWEWGSLMRQCRRDLVTLQGHQDAVFATSFSPDGTRVISAGHDGRLILWDAVEGEAIIALKTGTADVVSAGFTADGKHVLLATRRGAIRVWDVNGRREVRSVGLEGYAQNVEGLSIAADGRYIAGRKASGEVSIWNAADGKLVRRTLLEGAQGGAALVGVSADGKYALTVKGEQELGLWDVLAGGLPRTTLLCERRGVLQAAVSADGMRVATGHQDGIARLWDTTTGGAMAELRGHAAPVSAIAFASDGIRVATGSHDKSVRIWDAQCCASFLSIRTHEGGTAAVAFAPNGEWMVTGGQDGAARVWDVETGRLLSTLAGHSRPVVAVAFSPDGSRVATGSSDGTAILWEAKTGTQITTLGEHEEEINSVAFSAAGDRLLTGGKQSVRLWSVSDGTRLATLRSDRGVGRAAAFSPQGDRMLTVGEVVKVWNAANGSEIVSGPDHDGTVGCAVFSPDGKRVASGGRLSVRVWDANTGEEQISVAAHSSGIAAVAFSPDGRRLATAGLGIVKLCDAESGRELISLHPSNKWVTSLAFSPDGGTLATSSEDGTVNLWVAFRPDSTEQDVQEQKRALYRRWLKSRATGHREVAHGG